jgi:hypothetical protein
MASSRSELCRCYDQRRGDDLLCKVYRGPEVVTLDTAEEIRE